MKSYIIHIIKETIWNYSNYQMYFNESTIKKNTIYNVIWIHTIMKSKLICSYIRESKSENAR